MTDQEILQHILQQLQETTGIEPGMKKVYADLVFRFPEDGLTIETPDTLLSLEEEESLRELAWLGYLKLRYAHHAYGWGYTIDLHGHNFQSLKQPDCETALNETIHDSGKHEIVAINTVQKEMPRIDLISPFALERIGEWMKSELIQFEQRHWTGGTKFSGICASLFHHLMRYMAHDRTEDHLAAAAAYSTILLHCEEGIKRGFLPESLNDLPLYQEIPRVHQNGDDIIEH